MPARNKRTVKDREALDRELGNLTVGEHPKTQAPASKSVKNLQDALIDGLHSISQWSKDFLDVEAYPKQGEVLDAIHDATIANFSAGNRVGKTFVGGITLLWKAFYRHHPSALYMERRTMWNDYKAVNTSLSFEQAKLAWNYALKFAQESKRFAPFYLDAVHSPFPLIKLRTKDDKGEWVPAEVHARSLAKKGFYLLGLSINHLQVDECAYVPGYKTIEQEVLKMRLADTGGSLFRFSTPNGRNHFFEFYEEGKKGDPNIVSRTLTTWDNPFVSRKYLQEQERTMIREYYLQNVMGAFVSLSDFFPLELIEALYKDVDYGLPVEPVPGGIYVMGADLGAQHDPTVVQVWRIDTKPVTTVFIDQRRGGGWEQGRRFVCEVYGKYQPVQTAIDATGGGGHVVEQIMNEDKLPGVIPFVFSHSSKPLILTSLQDAAQRKRFVFPYGTATQELVQQMSFYRIDNDKDLTQDHVMALALVNHAYDVWAEQHQVQTTLYDDLMFIEVQNGGEAVSGDVFGPGTLFRLDPERGMFLPDIGGIDYGFEF